MKLPRVFPFLLVLGLSLFSCPNLPSTEVWEIRFLTVGDQGMGNEDQIRVAQAMKRKVDQEGADFIVLLGDNFYPSGVTSVTDPQWVTKFENLYGSWGIPVYPVLGNHDYGGGGGTDDSKGPIEVAYTHPGTQWTMPGTYYHVSWENAEFIFLDTNWILRHGLDDLGQSSEVKSWVAKPGVWKFLFGHHPSISNGPHGNAGAFDASLDPLVRGDLFKSFLDGGILSSTDFYFSGHDHNLQVLPVPGGRTTQIISGGGGGGLYGLPGVNPVDFQLSSFGFTYVKVGKTQVILEVLDDKGTMIYTQTYSR